MGARRAEFAGPLGASGLPQGCALTKRAVRSRDAAPQELVMDPKPAVANEEFALSDAVGAIQAQEADGGTGRGGEREDFAAAELEMLVPAVAGVEKGPEFTGGGSNVEWRAKECSSEIRQYSQRRPARPETSWRRRAGISGIAGHAASMPGILSKVGQASRRDWTRHARVRASPKSAYTVFREW
jgi:hypothetical protein